MSGQVEYYVGMRVIAQGREGTISRVLNSGYDVNFPDGQVAHNLPAASITPFDTAPVNKQEGGPPPPEYNPGVSAPVGVVTNPVIYQGYHPQQQTVHGPHGGATVVIHAATATPVTVSASSSHLNAPLIVPQSNKVPGYAYSPNIGEPLNDLFNFDASCWMACCCPCIIGGQVTQKLGVAPYALVCCGYIVICLILFFVCILMDNLLPFILLWIGWGMFVFILRMKVKSLWQISGQGCEECVLAIFCIACSLAQVLPYL